MDEYYNTPSVAVIIPAYNAEPFLERAVQSVLDTGYSNLVIAIIDDGSTDNTLELAKLICSRIPFCFLYHHKDYQNKGVSASRNLGICQTRSDWIAFLDADDTYLQNRFDCLENITKTSKSSSIKQTPDAFYGTAKIFVEDIDMSDDNELTLSLLNEDLFGIKQSFRGNDLLRELLRGCCWAISAFTVKRSLIEKEDCFDTTKSIAEDCDLWFRLATIGNILPYDLSKPISCYHRHSSNTYNYKIEHRIAMLTAMLDSWQWAESIKSSQDRLEVYSHAVPDYAYRSIIAGRQAGRLDIILSVFRLMLLYKRMQFFFDARVIRQYRHLLFLKKSEKTL